MSQKLCRYQEIFPYRYNTIQVPSSPNKQINGSWINIPYEKSFIATQGPPERCIDDFWFMCFDYNINTIIMLCNEIEEGEEKCSKYWDLKNSSNFKIINIEKKNNNEIFTTRKINIQNLKSNNNKTYSNKIFSHIQFKKWPDQKSPNIVDVLHYFEKLFEFMDINKGNSPPVIHCSAGVGRTGTFLVLYLLYKEILRQISTQSMIIFNVFNLVRKLKEMRLYMVQTISQYEFIYTFIEELLNEKNINR